MGTAVPNFNNYLIIVSQLLKILISRVLLSVFPVHLTQIISDHNPSILCAMIIVMCFIFKKPVAKGTIKAT